MNGRRLFDTPRCDFFEGSWIRSRLSDPLFDETRRYPVTIVSNVYRVVVRAQPEAAFAYVSDLTRHGEWSGGHLKVEALSPGPVAVGAQYVSHGDVAGQKDRPNQLRVTEYQSPSRSAFVPRDRASAMSRTSFASRRTMVGR